MTPAMPPATPQREQVLRYAMDTTERVELLGMWLAYFVNKAPEEERIEVIVALKSGKSPRGVAEDKLLAQIRRIGLESDAPPTVVVNGARVGKNLGTGAPILRKPRNGGTRKKK